MLREVFITPSSRNWEFPFPDLATHIVPPELYFLDVLLSPSIPTYVVVQLSHTSPYFISPKMASSTLHSTTWEV